MNYHIYNSALNHAMIPCLY